MGRHSGRHVCADLSVGEAAGMTGGRVGRVDGGTYQRSGALRRRDTCASRQACASGKTLQTGKMQREGISMHWLRRTAVGESAGAGVDIEIGASVGVTMGVLVGSGATSANSAGRLRRSILTETACASYCPSCICSERT